MDHSVCGLSLLTKKYVWHIGEALLQQQLEEWKLLYLSAYNGLSFNRSEERRVGKECRSEERL